MLMLMQTQMQTSSVNRPLMDNGYVAVNVFTWELDYFNGSGKVDNFLQLLSCSNGCSGNYCKTEKDESK